MGYFISSVLHFYSITYTELMAMPIYTFWELFNQINNVSASEDRRQFSLMANVVQMAFGTDAKAYLADLDKTLRSVYYVEEQVDNKKQLNKLKTLIRG